MPTTTTAPHSQPQLILTTMQCYALHAQPQLILTTSAVLRLTHAQPQFILTRRAMSGLPSHPWQTLLPAQGFIMATPLRSSSIAKASPARTSARNKLRSVGKSAGFLHEPPVGYSQALGNVTLAAGKAVLSVTGTNTGEQPPRVRRLQHDEEGVWMCEPTTGLEGGCTNLARAKEYHGRLAKCIHIQNWEAGSVKHGGTFWKPECP